MSESPNQNLFNIQQEDIYVYIDENGKAVVCIPIMTFIEILLGLYAASDNTCKTKEVMIAYKKSDSPKNVKDCLNIDSKKFNNLINTLLRMHPMNIIEALGRTVMYFNFIGFADNDGYGVDISEQHDFLYIFCNTCGMLNYYKDFPINIPTFTRNNARIILKVLIDNGSTSRNRHNTLEEKYILYNAKNFFAQKYNLDFLNDEIFNDITEITDDKNHLTIYKNDGLNALGEKILVTLSNNISEIPSIDIQDWLLSDNLKAVLIEPFTTAFEIDEKKDFIDAIKERLIIKLEELKELKEESKEVIPGDIWNFELPENFLTNDEQIPDNSSHFAPIHYMQCIFYTCLYYSYSLYEFNESDENIEIMRQTLINVLKIRDDFQKESLDQIYSTTEFSLEFLLKMILGDKYNEVLIKYVNNLYKNSIETAPHVTQNYLLHLKENTIFNAGFLNKHNGQFLVPLKKLDELFGDGDLLINENISNGEGKVPDELELFIFNKSVTKDELNKLPASIILSNIIRSNTPSVKCKFIENLNLEKTKECINYLFNSAKETIIEHRLELLQAFANILNQREEFAIELYIDLNANQFIGFYKVVGKNIFTIIVNKYNSFSKNNQTKFKDLFSQLAIKIEEKDDKLTQDFTNDYFEVLQILSTSNVKDFGAIIENLSVKEIMQHENIINSSIKLFSQNHIEEIINFLLNSDNNEEKTKYRDILNQFVNFKKSKGRARIFCVLSIEHFYFLYENTEIGNDIFISVPKYSKIAKHRKFKKIINDKYLELFTEIIKANNKFSQNFINGYFESLTFLLNSEFCKGFIDIINIISNLSIETIWQRNLVKFITTKNLEKIISFLRNPENNSEMEKEKYSNILDKFIECIKNKEANKIVIYKLSIENFIFLSEKYPEILINDPQEYNNFSVSDKNKIITKYKEFAKKIKKTNELTPNFINLFFQSLRNLLNSEVEIVENNFLSVLEIFSVKELIQYNVINDFVSFFNASQVGEIIDFIINSKNNNSEKAQYNALLEQYISCTKNKYIFYEFKEKRFNFLLKYPEILINETDECDFFNSYVNKDNFISKYKKIAKNNKLPQNFIEKFLKSLSYLSNSKFGNDFIVSFFTVDQLQEIIDFIRNPQNNEEEKRKYNNMLDIFIECIRNKKAKKTVLYDLENKYLVFLSEYLEVFINDLNEFSTINKRIVFNKYDEIATEINNKENKLPETFVKNFFASLSILLNSDWKTTFVKIVHCFSIDKLIQDELIKLNIIYDFANFFDEEQLKTIIYRYYNSKDKSQTYKDKLEKNSANNNSQSEDQNKLKKFTERYNKYQNEELICSNVLKKWADFNDKDKITICHNVCYELSIDEFIDIYKFFGKNIFINNINDLENMKHYKEDVERCYYVANNYHGEIIHRHKVTNKYIELAELINKPDNDFPLSPELISNFWESLAILLKSNISKDFIEVSYHFSPEIIFEHKDIFFNLPDFFDIKNLKRFLQYYSHPENDEQKRKCFEILQAFVKFFGQHAKHFFNVCYKKDLTVEEFILFHQFTKDNIFINNPNEINPEYAHFYYDYKIDVYYLKNKYEEIGKKFNELPENFMNGYLHSFDVLLNSNFKHSFIEIFNNFSVKKLVQLGVMDKFFKFLGANQFNEIIQYYNDSLNEEKRKYENLLLRFIVQNLKDENNQNEFNYEGIYDICYKLSAKSFIVIYKFIGNNIFKIKEQLENQMRQSYYNYNCLDPIKNKCCELIDEISRTDNLPTNFINDFSDFLLHFLEQREYPLIICKCLLSGKFKFPNFEEKFEQFKENEEKIIDTASYLPNEQFIALYNLFGSIIFVKNSNYLLKIDKNNLKNKYKELAEEFNKPDNNLPENFIKDFFESFNFLIGNKPEYFRNILNENFSFAGLFQYKNIILGCYQKLLKFFSANKLIEGLQYYNSLEDDNPIKENCKKALKMFFNIIKQSGNEIFNLWDCFKIQKQGSLFNEFTLQFVLIIELYNLFGKDIFIIKIADGNNYYKNRDNISEYYDFIIKKIKKNSNDLPPNFIEDFLKILPNFYSKNRYYKNLLDVFSFDEFIQLRDKINLSNVIDENILESGLDYYDKNNDDISKEILQNFADSIKDDKERILDICFKLPDENFIRFWEFTPAILIKKEDPYLNFFYDNRVEYKYISIARTIKIHVHDEFIMDFWETLLSWGEIAAQAIMEIPFDILIKYPEISKVVFMYFTYDKFKNFLQFYNDLKNNTDEKNKCYILRKQLLSTKDVHKHILQLKPRQVMAIIHLIIDNEFVALVNNFYLRREDYDLYYYCIPKINVIKENFRKNFFWVDEKEIDDAANEIVNGNKTQDEIHNDLKKKNKSPKKILRQRFPFVSEKDIDDATSEIINKSADTGEIVFELQRKNDKNIEQLKSLSKDIVQKNIFFKNILPEEINNELTQQVNTLNKLVENNSNIEEQRKSFMELNNNSNDILGKIIMYFCCMVNDIISFISASLLLATIPEIIVEANNIIRNENLTFTEKTKSIYNIFAKLLIPQLLREYISINNLPIEKTNLYFNFCNFLEMETISIDNYYAHIILLIENIELDKKELNINNINENIPKMENFSDFRER